MSARQCGEGAGEKKEKEKDTKGTIHIVASIRSGVAHRVTRGARAGGTKASYTFIVAAAATSQASEHAESAHTNRRIVVPLNKEGVCKRFFIIVRCTRVVSEHL